VSYIRAAAANVGIVGVRPLTNDEMTQQEFFLKFMAAAMKGIAKNPEGKKFIQA